MTQQSTKMITKNFTAAELNCRCGKCKSVINIFFATNKLQPLREAMGIPLPIASGARCVEHNAAEGGAPNSRHLYGDAVDITWSHMTGEQRLTLVDTARRLGFTGFGLSPLFLHLDTREGDITIWFYAN